MQYFHIQPLFLYKETEEAQWQETMDSNQEDKF